MKKILFIVICTLFFCSLKGQKSGILVEGKCYKVINGLNDYFKNDTLAIKYFKDFYSVSGINIPSDLYKKESAEIIVFFNDSIRKNNCDCYIRGFRERNTLLTK